MKIASRSAQRLALSMTLILLMAAIAWYGSATRADDPTALARKAISADPNIAHSAIVALRAEGPTGLQTLCTTYDRDIQAHTASPMVDPHWGRITAALDAVGQQKDCYASRLYWYTDLAQAEHAAQVSGKPILSLRLLGNLNEELSCANSRFFRTVLYPNAQVSAYLRTHYVLHWQSERPVPVFTLDFGDGRKIVRTLTGNSIHYILDPRGRPVDALPGLYGPQAFLRHLIEDEGVAKKSGTLSNENAQRTYVQGWHQEQFDALTAQWTEDCKQAYGKSGTIPTLVSLIAPIGNPRPVTEGSPTALRAGSLALAKSIVEMPVVRAVSPEGNWAVGASSLEWGWDQMGQVRATDAVLDASSITLMMSKHPDLSHIPAVPIVHSVFGIPMTAQTPSIVAPAPDAMKLLVANFERSIAQDSARNEYVYHAKLHQWFASGQITGNVAMLDHRVYSDLFQTPDTDRWLGLAPAGAYTALPYDGLVDTTPSAAASTLVTR